MHQCPFYGKFETQCATVVGKKSSLDNERILEYCMKKYVSCPKYTELMAAREKRKQAKKEKLKEKHRGLGDSIF